MKISELKSSFLNGLEGVFPSEEILSFFNILSEKYLSLSRMEIALNPEKEVSKEDLERFQKSLLRLKEMEPIQYILGETEFYGLLFKVNKHTLIPRPETEELVEWIVTKMESGVKREKSITILDIGTGSGCIAISLAKNLPHSTVQAIDISSEAINVANQNALLNEVKIDFFLTDVLSTNTLPSDSVEVGQKYDVIVSNPPYILELEKTQMQPNVLEFEPESALFVHDLDPLIFYRAISRLAKTHLNVGGILFFEINEGFKLEMETLLKNERFKKIEVKKDIYGKDRMVKCSL